MSLLRSFLLPPYFARFLFNFTAFGFKRLLVACVCEYAAQRGYPRGGRYLREGHQEWGYAYKITRQGKSPCAPKIGRQETRGTKKEPATKTPKNGRVDREANFAEGGTDSGEDRRSAPSIILSAVFWVNGLGRGCRGCRRQAESRVETSGRVGPPLRQV